jgi:hypothetical protein
VEAATDAPEPIGLVDLTGEPIFPVSIEGAAPTSEPAPFDAGSGMHFTEMELSAGDTWDTDAWAAGFTPDDEVGSEFEAVDSHGARPPEAPRDAEEPSLDDATAEGKIEPDAGTSAPEIAAGPTATAESVATEPEPTPEQEAIAEPESVAEPEPLGASETMAEPEPIAEPQAFAEPEAISAHEVVSDEEDVAETVPEAEDDAAIAAELEPIAAAEPETVVAAEPEAEAEPEPVATPEIVPYMPVATGYPEAGDVEEETPGVVAYSPEPPPEDELPHFTPRQPTVREFFATLGSRRPPAAEAAQSFTARAAIPGEDLPLATDAFAGLFGEAPVAEEDTRAAFALTGAISGKAHSPVHPRVQTSPPRPSPAIPDEPAAQAESEEDIRRFREWLDGLAQS